MDLKILEIPPNGPGLSFNFSLKTKKLDRLPMDSYGYFDLSTNCKVDRLLFDQFDRVAKTSEPNLSSKIGGGIEKNLF